MSDKQKTRRRRKSSDNRRTYSAPRVLEEQSFERVAIAGCDKAPGPCLGGTLSS